MAASTEAPVPQHGRPSLAKGDSAVVAAATAATAATADHQHQHRPSRVVRPRTPEYRTKEPSLDGLFPKSPGRYTLENLNLQSLGVEVFSRERVRGLSGVEVKTVINGDFVKKPRKGSTVVLHYIAFYSTDHTHGKMFDCTYNRGRPLKFRVGCHAVFSGLEECVRLMCEGEKSLCYIPPHMAFGTRGFPALVPPNAALIMWIVLEEILPVGYEALRSLGGHSFKYA